MHHSSHIRLASLLLAALLAGCTGNYRIAGNPAAPGSLLLMHIQLPEGLRVEEAAVVNQRTGFHYSSTFRASHTDADLRGLIAVDGLPPGEYYLGRLLARSKKSLFSSEWLEVNMEFRDPNSLKPGQSLFKVATNDGLYAGSFSIFSREKKSSLLQTVAARHKIPAARAGQAIFYETVGHMEATTREYLFFQQDHPAMGVEGSRQRKKEILSALLAKLPDGHARQALQKIL
jgi:hypothetical protein